MKYLGKNLLHSLWLLTEWPATWPSWVLVPIALALAATAGLGWSTWAGPPALGWAVALCLAALALADWALFAWLPRRGLSFGAVQPPWLGLAVARWLLALAALALAGRWPIPALVGLAAVQVGLWAAMAHGTIVAPFQVQITRLNLSNAKLSNPGTPLRILHLSDLHVERLTRRERSLPGLVESLAPDLIVITGDLLNTSYNDDPQALSDLGLLLGQLHAPGGVYAVWGTVEVDLPDFLRPVLESAGIVLLEDRAVERTIGDHRLWLMGVSCSRDLVADGQRLRKLVASAPPAALTLLLYHTPDLVRQAAPLGVDLYLAGHTHGGQWRLPIFGALLTSSHYWKRYEAGHYQEMGTHLYVSRGLGMEGFGTPRARFFCPPEVVSITLSGASAGGAESGASTGGAESGASTGGVEAGAAVGGVEAGASTGCVEAGAVAGAGGEG